jgi:hypothetical protein
MAGRQNPGTHARSDLAELRAQGNLRGNPRGRVTAAKRRHEIITMLIAGATETEIAETLGLRPNSVSKVIINQLEKWENEDRATIEHVRELQLKRIDRLIRAHMPAALGLPKKQGDPARDPSVRATAEIRKLEEFRARIAGTEAPKRIEVAGEVTHLIDAEEAQRLEEVWAQSGGDVIEGTIVEEDGSLERLALGSGS